MSHHNHLIHGTLFGAVFGLELLSKLLSATAFFNMGCHWLRVVAAVDKFVESYFRLGHTRRAGLPCGRCGLRLRARQLDEGEPSLREA